ncbi:hypothetical protein L3V59_19150 [Burkholderia aenigmatica]|uniref:hypothetical protein n=1 Tax=Burkholderia aenigmatica TaxID=2015348 RepID=UPI001F192CDD|nr:hypothetical protein [Burkholderia aenigmatica]UKD15080.1 hypothetical protein L3V59_19150 [Burkholderia aenigmatica]
MSDHRVPARLHVAPLRGERGRPFNGHQSAIPVQPEKLLHQTRNQYQTNRKRLHIDVQFSRPPFHDPDIPPDYSARNTLLHNKSKVSIFPRQSKISKTSHPHFELRNLYPDRHQFIANTAAKIPFVSRYFSA